MKSQFQIAAGRAARALWLAGLILSLRVPMQAQVLQPALSVNGSPLVTTRPVTRIGEEWFLPLVPIAEALGIEVSISADSQELRARHQNGTEISYDGRTGQIRHGHVLVGQVKNSRQVQFAGPREDFLFPLSGVVVLLGVEAEEDLQHSILRLDSRTQGAAGPPAAAPMLDLASLDYHYIFTTNTQDYSQSINLSGDGVAGISRWRGNVLLSRYPGQPVLNFNQGSLRFELPRAREIALGDQGIYSGLEALTATVRGAGYAAPFKGYRFQAYGGQSVSASFGSLGGSFTHYDTAIAGFSLRRKSKSQELSIGGHAFSGRDRRGSALGLSYGRLGARNQFKSQLVVGYFSGLSSRSVPQGHGPADSSLGTTPAMDTPFVPGVTSAAAPQFALARVEGPAFGLTLNDTFSPIRQLSVSGQFDYYGRNFLTPRQDSRYNAQANGALSVIFRPIRYASVTAGINRREYLLGTGDIVNGANFGALATMPGRYPLQFGFFRSEQAGAMSAARTALTQFSLILPALNRISAYAYYSEMELAGVRSHAFNGVFGIDLKSRGRLTLSEQLQLHSGNRLGLDWYLDLPRHNGFIRLGIDRVTSTYASAGFAPLVGIRLPLPRGHSLEVSYYSDPNYRTLRIEIGGRLVHEPVVTTGDAVTRSIIRRAPITGRVFLDENLNGTYDPEIDKPVAQVQIRLDNAQSATTDARGIFRFEQIEPGAHSLQAGLEGLPADMIFSDVQDKTMAVLPYRDNVLNFSVVRTGRIVGKVTYLDYGRNPEEPVERPLPDVRITAGPKHDSYSELNGIFLIGDLPPGSYELKLDPETLPEGYASRPPSLHVTVKPGNAVTGQNFVLVVPPKPIVQKTLPPQAAEPQVTHPSSVVAVTSNPSKSAQAQLPKPADSPSKAAALPAGPPRSLSQQPPAIKPMGVPSPGPRDGTARPAARTAGSFQIQIDSAQTLKYVEERVKKLRQSGFSCRIVPVQVAGKGTFYRIRLTGYGSRESAISAGETLVARGLTKAYWVIR